MLNIVEYRSFGAAHLRLVTQVLTLGHEVQSDYDSDEGPYSRDAPAVIRIQDPWWNNEPIFSKAVYDSAESLIRYRDEVVYGTMDEHAEELSYTYHDRFKDQIGPMLDELHRNPYTRRAQIITWRPEEDPGSQYPPCFQRAWFRTKNKHTLDMHTHWRSRDAWKAWGSNVFAFAHLHGWVAHQVGLLPGEYIEMIDSCHVYGRDIEQAQGAIARHKDDWEWPLREIVNEAGGSC